MNIKMISHEHNFLYVNKIDEQRFDMSLATND